MNRYLNATAVVAAAHTPEEQAVRTGRTRGMISFATVRCYTNNPLALSRLTAHWPKYVCPNPDMTAPAELPTEYWFNRDFAITTGDLARLSGRQTKVIHE